MGFSINLKFIWLIQDAFMTVSMSVSMQLSKAAGDKIQLREGKQHSPSFSILKHVHLTAVPA